MVNWVSILTLVVKINSSVRTIDKDFIQDYHTLNDNCDMTCSYHLEHGFTCEYNLDDLTYKQALRLDGTQSATIQQRGCIFEVTLQKDGSERFTHVVKDLHSMILKTEGRYFKG